MLMNEAHLREFVHNLGDPLNVLELYIRYQFLPGVLARAPHFHIVLGVRFLELGSRERGTSEEKADGRTPPAWIELQADAI
jgi:hypothetical protein